VRTGLYRMPWGGRDFRLARAAARRGLIALLRRTTRGYRPETTGKRFIAVGVADAANDVLAAKLFQIVCGVARTVLCAAVVAEAADPSGDIGGGEAIG
jgi:hypothetical protein